MTVDRAPRESGSPASLSVRGHRLEYATWGPATPSRALLLLHEGLGSVSTWRDFPAALSDTTGWQVAAYSRLGHGGSDPAPLPRPVQFMHDEAEGDLPAVIDALGLQRPIVLGHSDGGSIALIAAASMPERVRALVLEAAHVFVEDLSIASIARIKMAYEGSDLRSRLARHHTHVDVTFRAWNDVWLDPDFRRWNIEALLPRVTCPVLLIQGEEDEYGTMAQVSAIAHQVAGPVRSLVLAECGHAPHRDQRTRVMDAIASFVQDLES